MRILLLEVIVAMDLATKEIAVRKLASSGRGFLRVVPKRPPLGRGPSLRALVVLLVAAVGCALVAVMCAPALSARTRLSPWLGGCACWGVGQSG